MVSNHLTSILVTVFREIVYQNDFPDELRWRVVQYTVYRPYQRTPSLVIEHNHDTNVW